MSCDYDFNDAQPNTFEVIPDNTHVPVIFAFIHGDPEDDLHATKDKRGRLVKLEATVTDGPHVKRRLFMNLMFQSNDDGDEGHKKAMDISKSTLRALVETARGYSPTDETPAAITARKLKKLSDLDKMECTVVVGVEKGQGTYSDKNVVKRIVPVGAKPADGGVPAAAAKRVPKEAPQQNTAW